MHGLVIPRKFQRRHLCEEDDKKSYGASGVKRAPFPHPRKKGGICRSIAVGAEPKFRQRFGVPIPYSAVCLNNTSCQLAALEGSNGANKVW